MHTETGRWVDTKRVDRICQICHSSEDVENEQHLLFNGLTVTSLCSAFREKEKASRLQQAFSVSGFSSTLSLVNMVVDQVCFSSRNSIAYICLTHRITIIIVAIHCRL